MGKEHCKSFFAHLLRNLFYKQDFGELPSARYPLAWHLTVGLSLSQPDLPPLKRFRCQSVQGCGPVSLS